MRFLRFTIASVVSLVAIQVLCAEEQQKIEADSIPGTWTPQPLFSPVSPSDDQWWKDFGDSTLNALIEEGEKNNYNLAFALRRIEIAQNSLRSASAGYFPTISATAGWSVSKESERTAARSFETERVDYFSAGLSMQWEIDIFGRIHAQQKAGEASVKVSKAGFDGMMVSVAANIAKSYFNFKVTQARLQMMHNQIASQKKIVDMALARHEAGLASGLDVAQARQVLLSTQASIPALESARESAFNSLAVLIGRFPDELKAIIDTTAGLPSLPTRVIPVGIPADLLRHRPDVIGAEMQLEELAVNIGIARKDFLPRLSLSASVGTDAHDFDKIFSSHSFGCSVVPQLSWTIFDGGTRSYNLTSARLQYEAGIDQYNMTILTAFQEVENAISAYTHAVRSVDLDAKLLEQAENTLALSVNLYRQGLTDFSDVASAQISEIEARDGLIIAQGNVLNALVVLYQSLGGWSSAEMSEVIN